MAVDISVSNDGGLLKEIIKEGTGEFTPSIGCQVKVHYTGTLLDGTKFDSSKDRNEPFEFELGLGRVIKGWDVGVKTMKKGEIAILTCSPEYAYGKSGSPPKIPPDATLKFEVEMIDWVSEDLSPAKDKGISRQLIKTGEGHLTPTEGGLVEIHITGKYKDETFEDRDVSFLLGEGEADGIVEGVEIALEKFKKGEVSKIFVKSKYAYGATGKPEHKIPPNADLEFTVELKNLEKGPQVWSLDGQQKLDQGLMFKEKGTTYFKNDQLKLAIKMYKKVVEYTSSDYDFKEEAQKISREKLLLSANLNLALCYLKTKQYFEAREACDKALDIDPKNEKALFRRGQALLELASPELALKDFQEVVKIEPNNKAAANQIIVCNNLIKKDLAREKKLYANMFEKFAKEDRQREELEEDKLPDGMYGTLGEWGQEERPGGRDATAFEKENPNILMLNANGTDEFKNM